MTTRWLAGVAIFALGFGCAQMMKVTAADAADDVVVDDQLQIVDRGDRFELINTGGDYYLVLVERKHGMPAPDPQIEWVKGSLNVFKYGLGEARIAKVNGLGILSNNNPPYRDCHPAVEDCVEPRDPLIFPKPPKPTIIEPKPDYEPMPDWKP